MNFFTTTKETLWKFSCRSSTFYVILVKNFLILEPK